MHHPRLVQAPHGRVHQRESGPPFAPGLKIFLFSTPANLVVLGFEGGVHHVGEGVEDLEPFEARDFARAIAGLEDR